MDFKTELRKASNKDYTKNEALSKASTLNDVLDFFSKSGSCRGNSKYYLDLFNKALLENENLTMKALFYSRDIRGGQGERENFRKALIFLADERPYLIKQYLELIPFYGRWDDLFVLFGTTMQNSMMDFVKSVYYKDKKNPNPTLLGKWMPSENASSKKTKSMALSFSSYFGITKREYRRTLTMLRRKIDVVETKMSNDKWTQIQYSKVPSKAMMIYKNAFEKHDHKRFNDYLEKVEEGKEKINSKTLFPYEIVRDVLKNGQNKTLQLQWDNLPDFTSGEKTICVVDTSGSMYTNNNLPILTSLSLGLYFAEKNEGVFKDHFITFSEDPKMEKIVNGNLNEKIKYLTKAHWEMNTNLIAVFELILNTAIKTKANENDMPDNVIIISDMQFDRACEHYTNFEFIDKMYKEAGYKRPNLIFWNVNASSDFPVEMDEDGTILISGASVGLFSVLMNGLKELKEYTPLKFMMNVLNSERYDI